MAEQNNDKDFVRVISANSESHSWDEILKLIAVHELNSDQIKLSAKKEMFSSVSADRLAFALFEQQCITNLLLTAIASKMLKPEDIVKVYSISQKQVTKKEAEEMKKKGEL